MAKKKSTAEKVENKSVRANMNDLIGFSSCIAIIISVIITILSAIFKHVDITVGNVSLAGIFNLIQTIALSVAVCLSAYYFARRRVKWFRITVYVCIIIYIILAVALGIWAL